MTVADRTKAGMAEAKAFGEAFDEGWRIQTQELLAEYELTGFFHNKWYCEYTISVYNSLVDLSDVLNEKQVLFFKGRISALKQALLDRIYYHGRDDVRARVLRASLNKQDIPATSEVDKEELP